MDHRGCGFGIGLMKTIVLFLALCSICFAADPFKPFLGKWNGTRKERSFGTTITEKIKLEGKKLPDGTIRLIETDPSVPSKLKAMIYHEFKPGGRYQMTSIFLNVRTVEAKGEWKRQKAIILISGQRYLTDLTGSLQPKSGGFTYSWKDLDSQTTTLSVRR